MIVLRPEIHIQLQITVNKVKRDQLRTTPACASGKRNASRLRSLAACDLDYPIDVEVHTRRYKLR